MAPVANNAAAPPTDLPKLPVPPVKDTLGRYLDAIKAVVTEVDTTHSLQKKATSDTLHLQDEYLRTEIKCGEFLSDQQLVKEVEEFLSKRREEHDNWVRKKGKVWANVIFLNICVKNNRPSSTGLRTCTSATRSRSPSTPTHRLSSIRYRFPSLHRRL